MSRWYALDSGTTHTRIWLLENGNVQTQTQIQAGVRDTSRTGSVDFLKTSIREALERLRPSSRDQSPRFAMAAGMITSGLGLLEVPHGAVPAHGTSLSRGVRKQHFAELGDLELYFVPGVRTGPLHCQPHEAPGADIIRGEETEIIGALEILQLQGPLLYLHLASHTKAVRIDSQNRIEAGLTTLTGELSFALRTQTILSHTLQTLPSEPVPEWLARGRRWARRFGLSRTLFLIRILEQNPDIENEQLASLFLGAMIDEDARALRTRGFLGEKIQKVILSGQPSWHPSWQIILEEAGASVLVLTPQQTEQAFLAGLHKIVTGSPVFSTGS